MNNVTQLIQRYCIKLDDPHNEARAGQFVYPGNHSDMVSGFIYCVENGIAEIVLFEPSRFSQEVIDGMVEVKDMNSTDWAGYLRKVLDKADGDIRDMWRETLS